jgi:LPXTG-motif cell wall-anchored protein
LSLIVGLYIVTASKTFIATLPPDQKAVQTSSVKSTGSLALAALGTFDSSTAKLIGVGLLALGGVGMLLSRKRSKEL